MSTARHKRGYVMMIVLVTSFLVIAFGVVLAQLTLTEFTRERQALLNEQAAQAMASARAWSGLHAAELADGKSVTLSLTDVLPAHLAGTVEVRAEGMRDGFRLVHCRVTLMRGGREVHREAEWPLAAPTEGPGSGA